MNIIEIQSLNLELNGKIVLKIDKVEFKSPGIYGIIGPNGSGKSTLLKVLSGIIENYSGNVSINGKNIKENRIECSSIMGSLIENPVFYSYSSPLEFMKYMIEMKAGRKEKSEEKTISLLAMVHIASKRNQMIGTLSTGELKRLGISSALAGNPGIILLDEPTENLDVIGKDLIVKILRETMLTGERIMIVTSHDSGFMEQICDEVIFLKEGVPIYSMALDHREKIEVHFLEINEAKKIPDKFNVIERGSDYIIIEGDPNPFINYVATNNIKIRNINKKSDLNDKYREIFDD